MKNDFLQNEKLFKALEELGLTKTEILVYLNSLRLGSTPASVLSRRIGLNRSTTRYTLENLVKKKLLVQSDKNGTFYFVAEDPEQIVQSLKTEQAELKQKEQLASRIMGDLKSIRNPDAKLPRVQYFEGNEGVKNAYQSIIDELEVGDEIWCYALPVKPETDYHDFISEVDAFVSKRVKKQIHARLMIFESTQQNKFLSSDEASCRETRIINKDYGGLEFANEVIIYKDTVCSICSSKASLFAYKLNHPEIAFMHKQLFEIAWGEAV